MTQKQSQTQLHSSELKSVRNILHRIPSWFATKSTNPEMQDQQMQYCIQHRISLSALNSVKD